MTFTQKVLASHDSYFCLQKLHKEPFLLKDGIFKHTKITDIGHFIYFHGRAHHNKATQQISYFYHASIFSYELNKKMHFLSFFENPKTG
jgi:hypothetical protein